ncbi:MAG: hypothetical protein H6658_12015 [Ardenticatenaceae bacterium]|nr:hypothetical protein [Ardenticatenaceae bacterium]
MEHLLPTKLYQPQLRCGYVSRPRLLTRLNRGLVGKLTLISAPAGFGKTTLLAEWIRASQLATDGLRLSKFAWLSLDEGDNDLSRFLTYLAAALQTAVPTLTPSVLPRLQATKTVPPETSLTLLIAALSRVEDKVGLVLDDYHLISNPAIHTALAFLLDHLPPQLHLIIASRSDPPLNLARWRVNNELNEVRAANLRFTPDETIQFLQQALGHSLSEATTNLLSQRTEGWVAGLQLAALSLRDLDTAAVTEFVTNFGGTHRHIFTYLVEEVLQRQPPFIQQFLLQTAFVARLTAPLCDAVTGLDTWEVGSWEWGDLPHSTRHSQAILEYLATNNLFLVPLDTVNKWFRYHALFAEALQARLQEIKPELIPQLHRRASHWYAANGRSEQAIRHALAAQDINFAADLIETTANCFWTQGHLCILLNWLNALPEAVLTERPSLCLLHAWLLLLHDRWAEASHRLHLVEQQLAILPADEPITRQHRGRWASIQGAMVALHQDAATAITWIESALTDLPAEDVHWQQVSLMGLGLAQLAEGQAQAAITTLHQTVQACELSDDLYLAFAAWWHQSEASWAQGCLHDAAACLRRLELLAERDKGNWLALTANAAVGWGMLAYERNDLAQAEQLLTTALPQIWPGGQPRVALQAYVTLARLAQVRGDAAEMQHYLDTAVHLTHSHHLIPEQKTVAAITARLYLAEGQLPEAHWQLENQGIMRDTAPDFRHEMGLLSLVRLYLAERQTEAAQTLLARLLPSAELAGRDGSIMEICLLQALALAQDQQPDRALVCLQRALTLAEPEQFCRLFVNEGRPLRCLLQQISPRPPYVAHLLAQMDENTSPALLDPLTDRELEILHLVAEGASNQTIANQLVISLGTVKGHINHILGKLEAHSRTEAVAHSRELGIL